MNTSEPVVRTYTIMEAAKLSGLPESTLRYYETRKLINPIHRDPSSKHRVYSEEDINYIISVACLNATGMSLGDMLSYLSNADRGEAAANEQIKLLEAQSTRLADEERYYKLRQKYLRTKIDYWKAIAGKNAASANEIAEEARTIAKEVKTLRISSKIV